MLDAIKSFFRNLIGRNKPQPTADAPLSAFEHEIAAVDAMVAEVAPPGLGDAVAKQNATVREAGLEERAFKAPDHAPDFTLRNQNNEEVRLSELLAQGPVILNFFRGRWCPYCNLELRAMQRTLNQFRELGAALVAISPQTLEETQATYTGTPLQFDVLSDPGNRVAHQYGLVYGVVPELGSALSAFGVDFKQAYGSDTQELPMPATYVVAPDGRIIYAFVSIDFTDRADPADLITTLRQLRHAQDA
jgi:peroxiredoxin